MKSRRDPGQSLQKSSSRNRSIKEKVPKASKKVRPSSNIVKEETSSSSRQEIISQIERERISNQDIPKPKSYLNSSKSPSRAADNLKLLKKELRENKKTKLGSNLGGKGIFKLSSERSREGSKSVTKKYRKKFRNSPKNKESSEDKLEFGKPGKIPATKSTTRRLKTNKRLRNQSSSSYSRIEDSSSETPHSEQDPLSEPFFLTKREESRPHPQKDLSEEEPSHEEPLRIDDHNSNTLESYFPTRTDNQDKQPSILDSPLLQVGPVGSTSSVLKAPNKRKLTKPSKPFDTPKLEKQQQQQKPSFKPSFEPSQAQQAQPQQAQAQAYSSLPIPQEPTENNEQSSQNQNHQKPQKQKPNQNPNQSLVPPPLEPPLIYAEIKAQIEGLSLAFGIKSSEIVLLWLETGDFNQMLKKVAIQYIMKR